MVQIFWELIITKKRRIVFFFILLKILPFEKNLFFIMRFAYMI
nr:MAG TPA: hypothetical protein [Bacteriophage sp.]